MVIPVLCSLLDGLFSEQLPHFGTAPGFSRVQQGLIMVIALK